MKSESVKCRFRRERNGAKLKPNKSFGQILGAIFKFIGGVCFAFGRVMTIMLLDFGIVMFMACGCIPMTVVAMSNLLGIGASATLADLLFVFAFPVLFIVLLWAVLAVWILRWVNRQISTLFEKIEVIGGGRDKFDASAASDAKKKV